MEIPNAKDDHATQLYQDMTESLNHISRPTKEERELLDILEKPHIRVSYMAMKSMDITIRTVTI